MVSRVSGVVNLNDRGGAPGDAEDETNPWFSPSLTPAISPTQFDGLKLRIASGSTQYMLAPSTHFRECPDNGPDVPPDPFLPKLLG